MTSNHLMAACCGKHTRHKTQVGSGGFGGWRSSCKPMIHFFINAANAALCWLERRWPTAERRLQRLHRNQMIQQEKASRRQAAAEWLSSWYSPFPNNWVGVLSGIVQLSPCNLSSWKVELLNSAPYKHLHITFRRDSWKAGCLFVKLVISGFLLKLIFKVHCIIYCTCPPVQRFKFSNHLLG